MRTHARICRHDFCQNRGPHITIIIGPRGLPSHGVPKNFRLTICCKCACVAASILCTRKYSQNLRLFVTRCNATRGLALYYELHLRCLPLTTLLPSALWNATGSSPGNFPCLDPHFNHLWLFYYLFDDQIHCSVTAIVVIDCNPIYACVTATVTTHMPMELTYIDQGPRQSGITLDVLGSIGGLM